jgi:hypothetical protein
VNSKHFVPDALGLTGAFGSRAGGSLPPGTPGSSISNEIQRYMGRMPLLTNIQLAPVHRLNSSGLVSCLCPFGRISSKQTPEAGCGPDVCATAPSFVAVSPEASRTKAMRWQLIGPSTIAYEAYRFLLTLQLDGSCLVLMMLTSPPNGDCILISPFSPSRANASVTVQVKPEEPRAKAKWIR